MLLIPKSKKQPLFVETGVETGTGFQDGIFCNKKPGTGCRDKIELFSATGIEIRDCNLFGPGSRFKIFKTGFYRDSGFWIPNDPVFKKFEKKSCPGCFFPKNPVPKSCLGPNSGL